jgi:hypothetical protein
MTTVQKRITVCFGLVIAGVLAWGLGTYAWLYYQDATAAPGVWSEGAFLFGPPKLILAALMSVLLTFVWAVCYTSVKGKRL